MREKIQEFLQSPVGKGIGIALLVVITAFLLLRVNSFMKSGDVIRNEVRVMNPDTRQLRWIAVGKNPPDGFHYVEYCFNNECGPAGGTPVVLNGLLGRPDVPTVCPVCGDRVVAHNPRPEEFEGVTPKDQR